MEIGDPLKEKDIKVRMGGHQIEGAIKIEDTLGEGVPTKMGDPLGEEDPLMEMEDPLIIEDPLMMEDPMEMDDTLETLKDEDHQVHKDPLDW